MQSTIFGQTKHSEGMGVSGGLLARYPKDSGQLDNSPSFFAADLVFVSFSFSTIGSV